MTLDRDLIDAVRDLDEHDLRRLFILARARLESHGVTVEGPQSPDIRLRIRFARAHLEQWADIESNVRLAMANMFRDLRP